jgi:DHA1 family multidrug/chloramphenicol efflux transport protein-like MFS transporter
MLSMMVFTLGIELTKLAYVAGGSGMFNLLNLISGLCWLSLVVIFVKRRKNSDININPTAA